MWFYQHTLLCGTVDLRGCPLIRPIIRRGVVLWLFLHTLLSGSQITIYVTVPKIRCVVLYNYVCRCGFVWLFLYALLCGSLL